LGKPFAGGWISKTLMLEDFEGFFNAVKGENTSDLSALRGSL
jgi:hypothetical protein